MNSTSRHSRLRRFLDAQSNGDPAPLSSAMAELEAGEKQTHWIWYVFPQLRGLGASRHAEFYAIADQEEAMAYLQDPLLAERYRVCLEAIITHLRQGQRLKDLLGPVDALKTISSVTLFRYVLQAEPATALNSPGPLLPIMDDFFELLSKEGKKPCQRTLQALR